MEQQDEIKILVRIGGRTNNGTFFLYPAGNSALDKLKELYPESKKEFPPIFTHNEWSRGNWNLNGFPIGHPHLGDIWEVEIYPKPTKIIALPKNFPTKSFLEDLGL